MIACVHVPHFAIEIERRDQPELREAPLIVTHRVRQVEYVFAPSAEAAQNGVQPGMPLRQAQVLCPEALFVPGEPTRYQRALGEVLEAAGTLSPAVEPAGQADVVTLYLDLRDQHRRAVVEIAQEIGQTLREHVQVSPAIGIAANKFTAYVAAVSVEPNCAVVVAARRERAFLDPVPVTLLPADGETIQRLHLLGIRTLGQLAALPASAVETYLGKPGQALHRLARGVDNRPVVPYHPAPSARAIRQLEPPVDDLPALDPVLDALARELAERLRDRALVAQRVQLVVRTERGLTHECRMVLRTPSCQARRLAQALRELLAHEPLASAGVELEATLDDLAPVVGRQLDLFAHGAGQERRVRDALQDVLARPDSDCFYKVALLEPGAVLLERRFLLEQLGDR